MGRLLRKHGRLRDAELWIRRAVQVAINTGDWEAQTLALNSLGNVFFERGNYAESRRLLTDALRAAQKHQMRERQGEILHDLFMVSTWAGDLDVAEQYARGAYDIYRTGHQRLANLAYDVAVLWLKRGDYSRALRMLKELPAYIAQPEDRVRLFAVLGRAAGACGDELLFSRAWEETWTLAVMPQVEGRTAPDLLELGLGAASLRKWEMAQDALRRALELAGRTGEADVRVKAEEALQRVVSRRGAEPTWDGSGTPPAPARDQLAAGFLSSLIETSEFAAAV